MSFFAQYADDAHRCASMRIDAHPMRIGRCIRMANPTTNALSATITTVTITITITTTITLSQEMVAGSVLHHRHSHCPTRWPSPPSLSSTPTPSATPNMLMAWCPCIWTKLQHHCHSHLCILLNSFSLHMFNCDLFLHPKLSLRNMAPD